MEFQLHPDGGTTPISGEFKDSRSGREIQGDLPEQNQALNATNPPTNGHHNDRQIHPKEKITWAQTTAQTKNTSASYADGADSKTKRSELLATAPDSEPKAMKQSEIGRHTEHYPVEVDNLIFRRLKAELDHALQQKTDAEAKMEKFRDQILKMQPYQQPSDVDIADSYDKLCRAIEEWAEKEFGDLEGLWRILRNIRWSLHTCAVLQEYIAVGGEQTFVKIYPETSVHLIMYIIMVNAYQQLLHHRRWVPGMDSRDEQVVNDILEGSKLLQPARDPAMLGLLRSETYLALRVTPKYAFHEKSALKTYTSTLANRGGILEHISRYIKKESFDADGLHDITLKAARLKDMLATSVEEYKVEWHFSPKDHLNRRILTKSKTDEFNLIDIQSGQMLSASAGIVWDEHNVAGQLLCVIFPGIHKLGKNGVSKVVSKATALAAFDQSVQRKGRGKDKQN